MVRRPALAPRPETPAEHVARLEDQVAAAWAVIAADHPAYFPLSRKAAGSRTNQRKETNT